MWFCYRLIYFLQPLAALAQDLGTPGDSAAAPLTTVAAAAFETKAEKRRGGFLGLGGWLLMGWVLLGFSGVFGVFFGFFLDVFGHFGWF